ncbi:universal stress protein [Nocardioides sambongensis]|uniref:universal stress protein n=1 Tax=Nocardioides sambongensis TaxID=2589074 RepID=UPI00112C03AB|nr:universal stress protein [Nocardioides sambongensis]
MTTIVVGVDESETAAEAARTAAELAGVLRADLLVVSAFPATTPDRSLSVEAPTARDAAEQLTRRVVTSLRAAHPGLSITADQEPGRPGEALARAAEHAGARLVVVGNKRTQGVSRVLGSVAGDVVRKAPCDVYIAHTHG